MKRPAVAGLAAILASAGCTDRSATGPGVAVPASAFSAQAEAGTVWVTSSADAGPGSFREAVFAANANAAVRVIRFDRGLAPIALHQPVTYSGAQALTINGNGATVHGGALSGGIGAFVAIGGGGVTVRGLTVRNAPGAGIAVLVPNAATGRIRVTLADVAALENGSHGILINDQAEYLTDPESTSPAGSAASLVVIVTDSRLVGNGFTALDQDGLRVNEGGEGTLEATILRTVVTGNGGDGVELDERGSGDAIFAVEHTELTENGAFSAADFDDGIDVDELGDGHLIGHFVHVKANANFEQGVDLNENDAGNMRVFMAHVEGSRNAEEGIEFEEDDDFAGGGDLHAELRSVTTIGNGANDGDAGLKLREKGEGDVSARIVNPVSTGNEISGVLVREDAGGDMHAEIVNALASGNAGDGLALDENGGGSMDVRVQQAIASVNAGAGVAAEGTGRLTIQNLTARNNGDGAVNHEAGVIVLGADGPLDS